MLAILNAITISACANSDSASRAVSHLPGTPISIGEDPLLTLGQLDGDTLQTFFRVRQPFLLGDDRIAVPLADANTIRVFDLDGNHVGSYGRPGPGPGEFTRLDQAWARGDTLEAY